MTINYDSVLRTVTNITVVNGCGLCTLRPRLVNTVTQPLVNLLGNVAPSATQVFTGLGMTLDSDLSPAAGWELGMGA